MAAAATAVAPDTALAVDGLGKELTQQEAPNGVGLPQAAEDVVGDEMDEEDDEDLEEEEEEGSSEDEDGEDYDDGESECPGGFVCMPIILCHSRPGTYFGDLLQNRMTLLISNYIYTAVFAGPPGSRGMHACSYTYDTCTYTNSVYCVLIAGFCFILPATSQRTRALRGS